jgi:CubicO group peptidase (beta-lactamase class C family)
MRSFLAYRFASTAVAAAVLAVLTLTSVAPSAAQEPPKDSAGGSPKASPAQLDLMRRFAEAINGGDRKAQSDFVVASFAAEALDGDSKRVVDDMQRIHAQSGGFEIVEVVPGQNQNVAIARLKTKRGALDVSLFARMSPEEPARLLAFRIQTETAPSKVKWPEAKTSEAEAIRAIADAAETLAAEDRFSGTVLVAKDDRILLTKAVGLADRAFDAKNKVDTKYNLGSMNKMFTAVSIAQLVAAGKLSFDDTIAKVMPDYPNKEIAGKVTIRQILTHTSGLGNIFKPEFFEHRERYRDPMDYVALCANDPLRFEPGTDWDYSNYGFALLGAIVERVSGQDYYDYVREHIFEPAGMKDTASYPVDLPTPNLATGYTRFDTGDPLAIEPRRTNVMSLPWRGSPAGGGYSTAPDLYAFARALRGGKLVSKEMAETLTSGKVDTKFGPGLKYGYGFIVESINGHDVRGHGGGAPGINSDLKIFWQDGYVVVVMGNYDPPAAQDFASAITSFLAR